MRLRLCFHLQRPAPVLPGSGRFSFGLAVAAWLCCSLGVNAQGPYAQPPLARPPVTITVGRTAASPWRVTVDLDKNAVQIRHLGYPALAFDVDADGPEDDRHYEGITPVFGTRRLEGRLYRDTVAFLSPDHDAGRTERVTVEALDQRLRIRFEGGSYRELSPAGSDAPVFLEAAFWVDKDHRMQASLNGLYYLFPSASGTRVFLHGRQMDATREFHPGTPRTYEYFEEVTRVDVEDPHFGNFRLDGLIQRLQLHAHGPKNADVFEIDMDHSYKDRGQAEVLTRLSFADALEPAAPADRAPTATAAAAPSNH